MSLSGSLFSKPWVNLKAVRDAQTVCLPPSPLGWSLYSAKPYFRRMSSSAGNPVAPHWVGLVVVTLRMTVSTSVLWSNQMSLFESRRLDRESQFQTSILRVSGVVPFTSKASSLVARVAPLGE